jgi:predicted extracellular nuclease
MTQVGFVSELAVCGRGFEVAPTELYLPVSSVDDFEAYEGMLVTMPQALYISEYYNFDRYGEIVMTSERLFQPTALYSPTDPMAFEVFDANQLDRITLDDGRTSQNPDPAIHPNGEVFDLSNLFRGGDQVQNLTGVLNYAFSLYRIQPTQGGDYIPSNPRTDMPADVGGNLKVASFNVLNYFTTLDSRGADDPEEFERQRTKIFAALADIDADVFGLMEIENNDAAIQDLVDGLNALVGAGTYAYVDTGAIGTDEIKVAFIYKPATVSLVGDYAVLDDPAFTNPFNEDTPKNRPALAQTFMDNSTGGIFTAVVNHFKSKGSACDPDFDPFDTLQANCNLTRVMAAVELANWLLADPTGSGDEDFLILGDLNAYDKEDPIAILNAAGFTDLNAYFIGELAYSYVFDGQLGYLDYALANTGLMEEVTGTTVWHINTDEPDIIDYDMTFKKDAQDALYEPNAYRSSDHDPVIVGLDVCDEIAPTLTITASTQELWPANHKYVTVEFFVEASDNFDQTPTVTLVSVESNEPDNGLGDGDFPDDIVIIDDFTIDLRAERSGTGEGRVYTITYAVEDDCGNITFGSIEVLVPHDKANGPKK